MLESAIMIANPTITNITLSTAQLILASVTLTPGWGTCSGYFVDSALHYVYQKGITTAANFPLPPIPAVLGQDIVFPYPLMLSYVEHTHLYQPKRDVIYYPLGMNALLAAVATQPVVISLGVNPGIFPYYKSGIMQGFACAQIVNHSALVVGYDVKQGFWIVNFT